MLPLILRHEEIARYEGGVLYTLDRRKYPFKKEYFKMSSIPDVHDAIRDMVTQGGGPMELSLKALLLARDRGLDLREAAATLSSARPTNRSMANTLSLVLSRVEKGEELDSVIASVLSIYDEAYDKMSDYGSALIKDGYGILTTCFAEHSFLLSLKKAQMRGCSIRVFVPETRPYMQGARLTLPSLMEMGIESYLITDGMPAFFMSRGEIDMYMTASDAILPDKSVSNKVGTLGNAISAKHYGIPYYPLCLKSSYNDNIEIEMRGADEVLFFNGEGITAEGAEALYPAFDIIPASLITGIITKDGIIDPHFI